MVSIPVWYDWESICRSHFRDNYQVSIPVWYDWENIRSKVVNTLKPCFNSSLVRLGVRQWIDTKVPYMFQFQFGTIGRIVNYHEDYLFIMFQFQFGTIGSFETCFSTDANYVSIPVWYDWEFGATSKIATSGNMFQFQFGTIGSIRLRSSRLACTMFQFQFGTIGRLISNHASNTPTKFQFQFGTIGRG